ncbi:MAG: hypothetical protein ACOY4I_16065 [Bacillota bacterium]
MKRIIVMVLAAIMIFTLAGAAFAEGTDGVAAPLPGNTEKVKHPRVKDLQGHDQLLQLREEGKAIREEIKADHQQIKSLAQAARQSKNKEDLNAVKPYRETLKQLHSDLKGLRAAQKANWEEMKAARQADDVARMQSVMNKIISTRQSINANLQEIENTLDRIIQALQSAPPAPPQQQ